MMEFVHDASPSDRVFGLIDLPLLVDCCMIFNINTIKSTSREMQEFDAGCEGDGESHRANLPGAF